MSSVILSAFISASVHYSICASDCNLICRRLQNRIQFYRLSCLCLIFSCLSISKYPWFGKLDSMASSVCRIGGQFCKQEGCEMFLTRLGQLPKHVLTLSFPLLIFQLVCQSQFDLPLVCEFDSFASLICRMGETDETQSDIRRVYLNGGTRSGEQPPGCMGCFLRVSTESRKNNKKSLCCSQGSRLVNVTLKKSAMYNSHDNY